MSACDLIRQCANQVSNLFNQINSTTDVKTRKNLGNQITGHIAQCVSSMGRSCQQVSVDQIKFADTGVTYDVIENLKGTKGIEAKVSCHKNISISPGGGGGTIPYTGGNGSTLNIGGYTITQNMLIVLVGLVLFIILIRK